MKRQIFLFALMFFTLNILGQEITEDKTDEFTNNRVVRTSWENIKKGFMKEPLKFRINHIDGNNFIELKIYTQNSVTSIKESHFFYLKFKDESIIKFPCIGHYISERGAASTGISGSDVLGINPAYRLEAEDLQKLILNVPVKLRIETSDGYIEEELKSGLAKKFKKAATVVYQTLNN